MADTDIVTRLAREAGAYFANDECDCCREVTFTDAENLARFAALVAEECAKDFEYLEDVAAAIRAKFKEPT